MVCKNFLTHSALISMAILVLSGCETDSYFNRVEMLKSSDANIQDIAQDPNVVDSGPDGGSLPPSPSPSPSASPSPSVSPSPTPTNPGNGGGGGGPQPSPSPSSVPSSVPTVDPTPDGAPLACGPSDTKIDATYKCHVSASNPAAEIHCVFKSTGNNRIPGAIGTILLPSSSDAGARCMGVIANSMLAKIPNLPESKGQYHFSGGLSACIQSFSGNPGSLRKMLSMAILNALAQENWIYAASPDGVVRRGSSLEALSNLSGSVVNNAYCVSN